MWRPAGPHKLGRRRCSSLAGVGWELRNAHARMATCFAAQSATHLLASSPTAAAVNNSCSPPQLLATGLQLESTQGLTRGLVLAHGVKGSRSHRAGGEELPPFREKGKEREREKLSVAIFKAGVGGWIAAVFLTARGFLAEFLVLLSKHTVSTFHNLQQHSHSKGRDGLLPSAPFHLSPTLRNPDLRGDLNLIPKPCASSFLRE